MGLVYDTASAHIVQVVKKMDVSPDIIPTEIDKNYLKSTTPTTQDPYYLDLHDIFYQLELKRELS